MSTQLTGASAKVLFESPAQLNLKKKLLKEGNFEIVSSGPESATNLDKGITIVRTKQIVSRDALTDEPVYAYKEFPIKHARENIADVFRRRLGRDAQGQLTVPNLSAPTMDALNEVLETYSIYLEPAEFTITKQGDAAFTLTAKNNCVIFYGKISFTNTAVVKAPLEVYSVDGEEVEVEEPSTPPSESGSSNEPESGTNEVTLTDVEFDPATATITGKVTGVTEVVFTIDMDGVKPLSVAVVDGVFTHVFADGLPVGLILTVTAGDKSFELVTE